MHLNSLDFFQLIGEEILVFSAVSILLLDLFSTRVKSSLGFLSCLGFLGSAWWFLTHRPAGEIFGFSGLWHANEWLFYAKMIIAGVGGLVSLLAQPYLQKRNLALGEFYFLLFSACIGAMLCISANNLAVLVVGVELLSLSSYILCGFWRSNRASAEASLKYFFNGAIASAIMLYAIALLYGSHGHFDFQSLASQTPNTLGSLGALLLMLSIGYKLALVPFHWWAADVYTGAPTPVSAFLVTVPKFTFFSLLWVLYPILQNLIDYWAELVVSFALLSMLVGNFIALNQQNPKRMLAYSSITHSGYLALGLLAIEQGGHWAMLVYFCAYALSSLGAFAVLMAVDKEQQSFKDYTGLGRIHPVLGVSWLLFMFSLGGFPLSVGFVAKFAIFYKVLAADYLWLMVIGLLNSVLSFFYYLKIGSFLFKQADSPPSPITKLNWQLGLVIVATVAGVLGFGILPDLLLGFYS